MKNMYLVYYTHEMYQACKKFIKKYSKEILIKITGTKKICTRNAVEI